MSQHKKDPDRQSAPSARSTITGDASDRPAGSGIFDLPEMAFQELYIWLIFVSSLDIMLTWVILRNGGEEVNPVANIVIGAWGLNGAILFKFALVLFVIVACEVISRVRPRTAHLLIWFGVLISAFPPVWSIVLLIRYGSELG